MMAEVGAAALGYGVNLLLDEVLTTFRHLKNRSANLSKLQNLLERLQPSLKELGSSVQDESHPAGKWVIKFREQLEKSRDLLIASGKDNQSIFGLYRTSKKSLEVYGDIQALLQEASPVQLASDIFNRRRLVDLESRADIRNTCSELEQVPTSDCEILNGSSSSAIPAQIFRTDSSCKVSKPEVTFGGEAVANEVINHLLNRDCKKWIGLWGMGGIGKTFTASKVYHDSSIQRHFSGGRFWLTVSKDQPSPNHLFKQLLEEIEGRGSVSQLPDNLETAKSYLKNMLERDGARVLLVLDDVWQKDVLEYLDMISESRKVVILVTTRDQGIWRKFIDLVKIFEIRRLSPEDSWQLFSYHSFRGREVVPLEVAAVAKNISEECQGLPLALEVIGSAMADSELVPAQKAFGQTSLRVWEIALERLKSANYGNNRHEALYLKLQLSVDSLQDQDFRLQDCFFYFAAFPKDEDVSVDELVRMWIAEGLVKDDENSSFSAEEEGKFLLGFLVAKSMIEVTDAGQSCKVHDVMRELVQRNLKRNFATGEEIKSSARDCLYAPGMKESKFPKEWTVSTTPFSVRRLSLRDNHLRQFPEPEQFNAPHLRVLILSKNWSLQSLSMRFFRNLSDLRVLDLSRTGIKSVPGALLRRLKSLVLLDLSWCKELQDVSDDLDSLHNLEYLLLDNYPGCGLQKLPRVNNLTQLKWFSAKVRPQEDIIDVKLDAHDGSSFWRGLHPRGTHHRRSRSGIPYVLPTNLRGLQLDGDISSRGKYSFDLSSSYTMEKLILRTLSCPTSMVELHHLKELKILDCYDTPFLALGKLRMLESLVVVFHSNLNTESHACEGAFASLTKLWIGCGRPVKKTFTFHRGTMPKIESLEIAMHGGQRFPPSITELHSLKLLGLHTGHSRIRNEDLEIIFKQPDCFPHLQHLNIRGFLSTEAIIEGLPAHILERHKQGNLSIENLSQIAAEHNLAG